jgi:site-specific DNA-cytosine methylase
VPHTSTAKLSAGKELNGALECGGGEVTEVKEPQHKSHKLDHDDATTDSMIDSEEKASKADVAAPVVLPDLRFFTPSEIVRLHCFPDGFGFPNDMGRKKQYQLLGNSLNCLVVARLIEYGLSKDVKAN